MMSAQPQARAPAHQYDTAMADEFRAGQAAPKVPPPEKDLQQLVGRNWIQKKRL